MNTNTIHTGDAFDVLPDLDDESIHAVVTDPPYGLAFMGRDWDDFEPKEYQEWSERWASECKRVLKPGGHLLAFSGNRTHHRLFTGVEDAGFEIRDTLTWHYGSGFPKASDVSKTIDKRADAEREVVGEKKTGMARTDEGWKSGQKTVDVTSPATDAAKNWDGWKTGLKPATEFVVMARKPYDGATVDSVLEHGTGALNIEACRVEANDGPRNANPNWGSTDKYAQDGWTQNKAKKHNDAEATTTEGRYPSNLMFDELAAEQLDADVGVTKSKSGGKSTGFSGDVYGDNSDEYADNEQERVGYDGEGGPSRYFYTSKATKAERTLDGKIDNAHPTVKPGDLMQWLVKLVTREGQVVLDPFAGSGTTCMAAKGLNRRFVGIERQEKWADVARVRCGLTPDDPSVVRGDDAQRGLEAFDP